ncbi:MAG: hypothetical protein U9N84_00040 [Actinomycetota bacterium]|nr:hypothetical protein [Actinomycetota bacterium]
MAEPDSNPLEQSVLAAFPWLVGGLFASLPLLLIPAPTDRRSDFIIQLAVLVGFLFALTWKLAPFGDREWFIGQSWSPLHRHLVTVATLIVIVTGTTGLVTLASSAAMGFQPSLQFLQLLSALDIAWVVGGIILAARTLWGRTAALTIGFAMSVVCVFSIGLYLAEVGLASGGDWLVDQEQMLRLVIPFDVAAATMTIGLTILAARRASPDGARQTPVV